MIKSTKKNIYSDKGGALYHQLVHSVTKKQYDWISFSRAQKIQPFIDSHDTLLEFGSGYGFNIKKIQCKEIFAYDLSSVVKKYYKDSNINFTSNVNSILNKKFSKIISHHVLEHVENPSKVLSQIKNLLSKDGTLLLYLPLEHSKKINKADKDHHLYSWTPQTIYNLLKNNGFNEINISVGNFGYDIFASRLAENLKLGYFGFRLLKKFCNTLRPVHELRIFAK